MAKLTKTGPARTVKRGARRRNVLTLDRALLALLIAAMNANEHVSPEESARAQHMISSMRRFRRRSGDVIDRLIFNVRARIEKDGAPAVMQEAARAIPVRLRPAAFAVAVDLVLVDGTLQRQERRFLTRLAEELEVPSDLTNEILTVITIKNSL